MSVVLSSADSFSIGEVLSLLLNWSGNGMPNHGKRSKCKSNNLISG